MIRQYPAPHDPYDGSAEDTPLVKLCYGLLTDCLKRGADRIHIFPSDPFDPLIAGAPDLDDEFLEVEGDPDPYRTFTIRVYANGSWDELMKAPWKMYAAFLQRLKVMASFSLARRPPSEGGRFRFTYGDSVYEIGVTVRVRPDGSQEAMIDLPSGPTETAKQVS